VFTWASESHFEKCFNLIFARRVNDIFVWDFSLSFPETFFLRKLGSSSYEMISSPGLFSHVALVTNFSCEYSHRDLEFLFHGHMLSCAHIPGAPFKRKHANNLKHMLSLTDLFLPRSSELSHHLVFRWHHHLVKTSFVTHLVQRNIPAPLTIA